MLRTSHKTKGLEHQHEERYYISEMQRWDYYHRKTSFGKRTFKESWKKVKSICRATL